MNVIKPTSGNLAGLSLPQESGSYAERWKVCWLTLRFYLRRVRRSLLLCTFSTGHTFPVIPYRRNFRLWTKPAENIRRAMSTPSGLFTTRFFEFYVGNKKQKKTLIRLWISRKISITLEILKFFFIGERFSYSPQLKVTAVKGIFGLFWRPQWSLFCRQSDF